MIAAALGFCFALWVSLTGAEALCVSSGCEIFAGFTFFGFSLWTWACAYFALVFVLALMTQGVFLQILTAIALTLEVALLCVMIFVAPCVNCLIVGAGVFATFYLTYREKLVSIFKILAVIWCFLFFANAAGVLKEQVPPYVIAGNPESSVSVYFSPSCSACETLILTMGQNPDIAWLPVTEYAEDRFFVERLNTRLVKGETFYDAYRALKADAASWDETPFTLSALFTRVRLWQNEAHLAISGVKVLPHTELAGVPKQWLPESAKPANFIDGILRGGASCVKGQGRDCP